MTITMTMNMTITSSYRRLGLQQLYIYIVFRFDLIDSLLILIQLLLELCNPPIPIINFLSHFIYFGLQLLIILHNFLIILLTIQIISQLLYQIQLLLILFIQPNIFDCYLIIFRYLVLILTSTTFQLQYLIFQLLFILVH